jgi:hypothetical protein
MQAEKVPIEGIENLEPRGYLSRSLKKNSEKVAVASLGGPLDLR